MHEGGANQVPGIVPQKASAVAFGSVHRQGWTACQGQCGVEHVDHGRRVVLKHLDDGLLPVAAVSCRTLAVVLLRSAHAVARSADLSDSGAAGVMVGLTSAMLSCRSATGAARAS